MGPAVRFGILLFVIAFTLFATAQDLQAFVPLQLKSEPRTTEAPQHGTFTDSQCDRSGEVYLRYMVTSGDSFSAGISRIDFDGSADNISTTTLPGLSVDFHLALFAVDDHGSLHGIARSSETDAQHSSARSFYLEFEEDGTLRSKAAFEQDMIPSILLPLNNGDFFAAGTTVEQDATHTGTPIAGIFGPDAKLKKALENYRDPASKALELKAAKLGDDESIYLLLVGERTKIRIVKQNGDFDRDLILKAISANATDMWVSGGRIMVVFEQNRNRPKATIAYALYDARTGDTIRVYHPAFLGSPACFQDGQSLTVLVPQGSTGTLGISEAQLQ